MFNLVEATKEIRIALKILALTVAAFAFIFFLFGLIGTIRKLFFTSREPINQVMFGRLPKIFFPEQEKPEIQYSINTTSGQLPLAPKQLKVFRIKPHDPNLYDLKNTRQRLEGAGFSKDEKKISDTVYQWTSTSNRREDLKKYILYDIVTRNFKISSNFYVNTDVLTGRTLTKWKEATKLVTNFINVIEQEIKDIDFSKPVSSYYKISAGRLEEVESLSNAHVIKISLSQKPIDNLKIYYQDFQGSNMTFLIGSGAYNLQILEASFNHHIVDEKTFSFYPIKTTQQAFKALQNGSAYIFNPDKKESVEITDILLGYYFSNVPVQAYLLPIFVFKGNNFIAYVGAVSDELVTSSPR